MKRLLAMLLALCLVFGQLPATVFATAPNNASDEVAEHHEAPEATVPPVEEEADTVAATSGTCGENLTWTLSEDGTLTISGTGPMENYYYYDTAPWYSSDSSSITNVIIESGVTTIGDYAFYYCGGMISVEIPESVTTIGNSSFRYCNSLDSVQILDSVTTIGDFAFGECDSLISVEIPDSVTIIGYCAFEYCDSLTGIYVDESNQYYSSDSYGVLYNKQKTTLIQAPGAISGSYVIPDSLTTIDSYAFAYCHSLISVEIPDSVITIGDFAFSDCTSLISVEIGKSVTEIGYAAFSFSNNLSRIIFTGDAPFIVYDAFEYVTATAYYPTNNPTWTSDVMQDYEGTITWVGLGDLVGLEIISAPTGVVGEEPDLSGLVVERIYSNDIRLPVGISKLIISDIDTSTPGRKTVTISYGDVTAEFVYGVHDGIPSIVLDPATYPESSHDYEINADDTQVFTHPGATGLVLVFSEETCMESGYDHLYVYDGADNLIAQYTGDEAAGITLEVPGDTVKIRLTSDYMVSCYGYSFDSISTKRTVFHTGTETTPGVDATCTEPGRTEGVICEICDEESYVVIPALGHDYESVVTEPTPEVNGFTTHTCTRCGDSYTDSITIYGVIAYGECGENVQWCLLENGTLKIVGEGEMQDYDYGDAPWYSYQDFIMSVVIEDGVTTVGDYAFYGCDSLISVEIGDNLTTIGDYAFFSCDSLISVEIGDNLTAIGDFAFVWCTSLISVEIPDGVTTIGDSAFSDCDSLISVEIGDSVTTIGDSAFYDCYSLISVEIGDSVTIICDYAFRDCDSLSCVEIPDSVTTIGNEAFAWCDSLSSVTIGNSVTTIGDYAFYVCTNLTNVEIPESVTTIGYSAFASCDSLTSIHVDENNPNYSSDSKGVLYDKEKTFLIQAPRAISGSYVIPDSVTAIGDTAFSDCDSLSSVDIGNSVITIGDYAFAYSDSLISVEIPDSVTTIGDYAFNRCDSLTAIHVDGNNCGYSSDSQGVLYDKQKMTLIQAPGAISGMCVVPDSVTIIGNEAFYDCANLVSVVIGDRVTTIGNDAFNDCISLINVTIPDSVTTIGYRAFAGCTSLTNVLIGNSVTTIDWGLFYYCYQLSEIRFLGDAPSIGDSCFTGVTATVYYPEGNSTWTEDVIQAYYGGSITWVPYTPTTKVASGWSGNTTWVLTSDGMLTFSGEGNMKNYDYAGGQPWLNKGVDIVSVVIEEGITGIGSGAFKDLTSLKSVTLPETLTKMGEAAFYGSGLESVEIPASLWTIQPYTFKNCTNLTAVKFNEGNLEKISDGAFYGTGLTEVVLPDCLKILDIFAFKGCANLTSITIGAGLTELREAVFYGTAIPTITIPEGITKIGPYALKNCVALETIDLPSTLTSVGEASFYACTALNAVELPDAVTEIGNYAFRKCESIETLTLSEELVTVGECAFYGCTSLTELMIPDKVITIKPYAFKTCTGLTSVTLGNSVETIGEGAFNTCTGIKTIVFPASLKTIGDYAFANSENLWKLTFQGNAPSIGTGAFKGLDAEAWYPTGNATWTESAMQNYGGKITWKSN